MKTTLRSLTTVLAIAVIALTGCKKYEDGPSFTLLTKKARVAGDWMVEKKISNGTDVTSTYRLFTTSETITLEKDGGLNAVYNNSLGGSTTQVGTWAFDDKKEHLVTVVGGTTTSDIIIKLTNTELWTRSSTKSTDETHLKSK